MTWREPSATAASRSWGVVAKLLGQPVAEPHRSSADGIHCSALARQVAGQRRDLHAVRTKGNLAAMLPAAQKTQRAHRKPAPNGFAGDLMSQGGVGFDRRGAADGCEHKISIRPMGGGFRGNFSEVFLRNSVCLFGVQANVTRFRHASRTEPSGQPD